MSTATITRAEFRAGVQVFFDGNTLETVAYDHPLTFGDEFIGSSAGIPAAGSPAVGYPWVKKIVGAAPPTVTSQSGVLCGSVACALAATSEAEEASLYWNDFVCYDTSKIGMIEWRAQLTALPTGVASAFLGAGSAWVGGPLNLARYAGFYWSGSGALKLVWQDGNGHTGNVAAAPIGGSAITTDTTLPHLYRIDFSNPADVVFYYDGNRVNAANSVVWSPSSAANAIAQPWATVYKGSATTDVATLTVEKIDIGQNR